MRGEDFAPRLTAWAKQAWALIRFTSRSAQSPSLRRPARAIIDSPSHTASRTAWAKQAWALIRFNSRSAQSPRLATPARGCHGAILARIDAVSLGITGKMPMPRIRLAFIRCSVATDQRRSVRADFGWSEVECQFASCSLFSIGCMDQVHLA